MFRKLSVMILISMSLNLFMKLFIILMILSVYFLCYDHFKSLLLTPIEYKNQIPQYDIHVIK